MSGSSEEIETFKLTPLSANVDWVTVTAKDYAGKQALATIGKSIVSREVEAGERKFPWAWSSYDGEGTRYVRWGVRDDTGILMLISYAAAVYWTWVRSFDVKPTRLDLRQDYAGEPEETRNIVSQVYQIMRSSGVSGHNLTYYESSKGGQTLYVGSRKSDSLIRFYDKTEQAKLDPKDFRVFRIEVELKGKKAQPVWRHLASSSDPEQVIISHLRTKVLRAGLPIFVPEPTIQLNAIESFARVTDEQRTLQWLRASVGPSIKRLVDAGKLMEVEQALGVKLFFI